MSLTAFEMVETQSDISTSSVGAHDSILMKSPAALKIYFSYLGLWRIEKVLLSYSMYQFSYLFIFEIIKLLDLYNQDHLGVLFCQVLP